MKIVGIFILALELIILIITLRDECRKNNLTFANLKAKWRRFKNLFK